MSRKRQQQTPGTQSKVYVPVLLHIWRHKYQPGAETVEFTLDDVREALDALNIKSANPPDIIYRMAARTILPDEIREAGFYTLRSVQRGRYRLEKAESTIIDLTLIAPDSEFGALDFTPLPVRRLLPKTLSQMDEQAILSVVNYSQILRHFTSLEVYRLRTHVRRSVKDVGQAEIDAVDVGVALRDDDDPVVLPLEAKGKDEPINRTQITKSVSYAKQNFPGLLIRPIAVKVDHDSVLHLLEFNATENPAELTVVNYATYRLQESVRTARFFPAKGDKT